MVKRLGRQVFIGEGGDNIGHIVILLGNQNQLGIQNIVLPDLLIDGFDISGWMIG